MVGLINAADLKRLTELNDKVKILNKLITEKTKLCQKIEKQIYFALMADYHFNQK